MVYAYYEGIDKIAHASGLGPLYDAELGVRGPAGGRHDLRYCPPGAALAVTADHGQVDVGARAARWPPRWRPSTALISGEARFRWLHSRPGQAEDLLERGQVHYGGEAWVASRDPRWSPPALLGGPVAEEAPGPAGRRRYRPSGDDAYLDPTRLAATPGWSAGMEA